MAKNSKNKALSSVMSMGPRSWSVRGVSKDASSHIGPFYNEKEAKRELKMQKKQKPHLLWTME